MFLCEVLSLPALKLCERQLRPNSCFMCYTPACLYFSCLYKSTCWNLEEKECFFLANQQLDWQHDQIWKSRQNGRGPGGGCGLQAEHCSCPVILVPHLDLYVHTRQKHTHTPGFSIYISFLKSNNQNACRLRSIEGDKVCELQLTSYNKPAKNLLLK